MILITIISFTHSMYAVLIIFLTILSAFCNKILIMKIRKACTDSRERAVKHISFANIKELLNILLTFTESHFQVWHEACYSTLRRKLFNFSNVSRFFTRLKYLYKTFLDFLWFHQLCLQRCFALINVIHFPLIGKATNFHTCLINIVPSFLICRLNSYLILNHEVQ